MFCGDNLLIKPEYNSLLMGDKDMGHTRKRNGKWEHSDTCFAESGAAAISSMKPDELKAGQKVGIGNKTQTYLGSTNHDGNSETHHFQDSKGNYSLLHPAFTRLRDDKKTCDSLESIQQIEAMVKGLK